MNPPTAPVRQLPQQLLAQRVSSDPMKLVEVKQSELGSAIQVGVHSAALGQVTLIASLTEFWTDLARYLAEPPAGPTVAVGSIELVPPVLPDARVFCIGLKYLKHAAEGRFRDQDLPKFPCLFARSTQSLTVDGAEIPVPANEEGLNWEGEIVAWIGAPSSTRPPPRPPPRSSGTRRSTTSPPVPRRN